MSSPGRRPRFVMCCLVALGMGVPAFAQTKAPSNPGAPKFAVPGSRDSASTGRRGAAPTGGADKASSPTRPKKVAKHRPNAPIATFPGFRLLPDGRSRIYVELSKSVSVDERRAQGTLTFTLRGAEVLARNNKNALITTHFATPVDRARLVPSGSDLDLVIDLRQPVQPTHQIVAGENGSARLEIDFPAGDYPLDPLRFGPTPGARGNAKGSRGSDQDESPPTDEPNPPTPPTENDGVGPPAP